MADPVITIAGLSKGISIGMKVMGFFSQKILDKYFPFNIDQINIMNEKFKFKLNYKEETYFLELNYKFKNNTMYPVNLMGISYTVTTWNNNILAIGDKQVFNYIPVDKSYDTTVLILLSSDQAKLLKKYYRETKKLLFKFEIRNHLQTYFGLNRKDFSFSPEVIDYEKIIL